MKTAKILAVCFVFLMGSILLGDFSSNSWAEENITLNDPAGNDMVSGGENHRVLKDGRIAKKTTYAATRCNTRGSLHG